MEPSSKKPPLWATVLVLAALLALPACETKEGRDSPDPGAPSPTGYPPPRELYGADSAKLFVMDLASTDIGEIAEPFNFHDIVMTPDAAEVIFMVDAAAPGRPSEHPDDPILFRAPYDDPGAPVVLGKGSGPVLSPDGSSVAAVRKDEVVVFDLTASPEEGEPEANVVLEGGDWRIAGWTAPAGKGDSPHLVAQDARGVWIADPQGGEVPSRPVLRDAPPVLAVSPAEPLVLAGGKSPALIPLGEGGRTNLDMGGGSLSAAEWSPDGKAVAVRTGQGPGSRLLVVDAESGEAEPVTGAENVGDEIIWMTPTGGYFLYEKINPGKRSGLMQCNPELGCQNIVSILDDVRILGLR